MVQQGLNASRGREPGPRADGASRGRGWVRKWRPSSAGSAGGVARQRGLYHRPMRESLRRHGGLFGGLIVAALIGGVAAKWLPGMMGPRGVPGPLLMLGIGAFSVLLVVAALTVVAIVVARLLNTAVGFFVLGAGLCVLGMQCGAAADIAFGGRAATAGGVETIVWALLVAGASGAIFTWGGPLPDVESEGTLWNSSFSPRALVGAVAAVAAVPALWIVLRNDLKGQAIAAAIVGGMAAGLFGRLWSPRTQPLLLFPATVLALGIAQLVVAQLLDGPLDVAFVKGTASRLLFVPPIDLAGGAVVGVAMGLGWAKSFMKEQTGEPAGQGGDAASRLRRSVAG